MVRLSVRGRHAFDHVVFPADDFEPSMPDETVCDNHLHVVVSDQSGTRGSAARYVAINIR
jgi:hypothetical protein